MYVKSLNDRREDGGISSAHSKNSKRSTRAAWWDYQRDRIYVKSANAVNKSSRRESWSAHAGYNLASVNKVIICPDAIVLSVCGGALANAVSRRTRTLYDLSLREVSVKRWIVKYRFRHYWCPTVKGDSANRLNFGTQSHFGRNLVAYVLYETRSPIPFVTVQKNLSRFFKLDCAGDTFYYVRKTAADGCTSDLRKILEHLVTGSLLHVRRD